MDINKAGYKGIDYIHLAQESDQWLAFVNTVMNIRVQ
jgi:hypothetical protein